MAKMIVTTTFRVTGKQEVGGKMKSGSGVMVPPGTVLDMSEGDLAGEKMRRFVASGVFIPYDKKAHGEIMEDQVPANFRTMTVERLEAARKASIQKRSEAKLSTVVQR